MATFVNGTEYTLKIAGSAIDCEISVSFSADVETLDILCKANAPDGAVIATKSTWGLEVTCYQDSAGTQHAFDILADQQARLPVAIELSSTTVGYDELTGNAIITNFTINAQTEETMEYSFSLRGDGPYTIGTT